MRSVAALRIFGDDLDPEELTRLLGREPTHARVKGQVTRGSRTGREMVARTGAWHFGVADREPDDLNGQVLEIFGQLNSNQRIWDNLAKRFRLDLFCGLFMGQRSEGLALSTEALAALGCRHVELGICLYDSIEEEQKGELGMSS